MGLVRHTRLAKCGHHRICACGKCVRAARDDFPKVVVIKRDQRQQLLVFVGRKIGSASFEQARENQIVFQKTTTAAPAQFRELKIGDHSLRGPLDQHLFKLANRARWIQALRAHIDAVHDGMAAKQPVRVFEIVETFVLRMIAAIRDEPIRRE